MRQIKFKMYCGSVMYSHDDCLINDFDPRTTTAIDGEKCHWLEFTGLRDKKRTKEFPNGQKIYEGDIIENENNFGCICGVGEFTDQYPDMRIIIFDDKNLCFTTDFVDKNMRGKGTSGFSLVKSNENSFEIIGNIHENKNLLES